MGYFHYQASSSADLGESGPRLAIDSSSGLGCDDDAVFRISASADCRRLSLEAIIDNCTGARFYLDGEVALERL